MLEIARLAQHIFGKRDACACGHPRDMHETIEHDCCGAPYTCTDTEAVCRWCFPEELHYHSFLTPEEALEQRDRRWLTSQERATLDDEAREYRWSPEGWSPELTKAMGRKLSGPPR